MYRTIRLNSFRKGDFFIHIKMTEDLGGSSWKALKKPLMISWTGYIPTDVGLVSNSFDNPILALEEYTAFVSRLKNKGFRPEDRGFAEIPD